MTLANQSRTNHFTRRTRSLALCGTSVVALGSVLLPGIVDSKAAGTWAQAAATATAQGDHQAAVLRIGTYDSRAVAVAYVRSDLSAQKVNDLLRQRSEAEKKGDKERVAELNSLGESMQIRKHLQGFSTAPVDDVLDTIRDRLPSVAQKKNVAVITREADFHSASVEVVDVTEDLVQLFKPDKQTLKIIADLRKQKPLAIEAVAKLPAKD